MAAILNRHARHSRSLANKAANRLCRDPAAFQMAINFINRRLVRREADLARDLMPSEIEELCEQLSFDDLVQFIQSLGVPACCK